MAFKYQALNDSRSSLNSLSSLGSSRSIESGGGSGAGRQRPRLEFSAAGTCTTSYRNSAPIMSEECSMSSQIAALGGEGVAKSGFKWRQSLQEEVEKTSSGQTSAQVEETSYGSANKSSTSGDPTYTLLRQKNCNFSGSSEVPSAQNTHSSSQSETGLYIHSSVRSGSSGIRFSRQVSTDRQIGGVPPVNHHHNQSREHGKLFKVLQKFSNKRAQQRVEMESEKRARKSPQHSRRGREKENVGHHKRSHKGKQGKKGQFPISKSSDLLAGFSDVVYRDNTEQDSLELEVEADSLIYANGTTDRLLGSQSSSQSSDGGLSHVHHMHNSHRGQKYLSMPPSCDVEDDGGTSSYMRASMRRASSLSEGVYHRCSIEMDTGTFPKSALNRLSRSGSKKSNESLLYQGESRASPRYE